LKISLIDQDKNFISPEKQQEDSALDLEEESY